MAFLDDLITYLNNQLQYEEEDIEQHKNLPDIEKEDQGFLIKNATVLSNNSNEYVVSVVNDNTKLRTGDLVNIRQNGRARNGGTVLDLQINGFTIETQFQLDATLPFDIEIIENTYIKSIIALLQQIHSEQTPSAMNFIQTLEGVNAPTTSGSFAPNGPFPISSHSFNQIQNQVIQDVLQKPSVYCIQGPPGTGKTAVLGRIAECYASNSKSKKVLIVANTHQAVNNALNSIPPSSSYEIAKVGPVIKADGLSPNVINYEKMTDLSGKRKKKTAILGMTLHSAANVFGLRNSSFLPEIVLVDEAGQIPMAYAAILGSFGCGTIVFLGDDKQLPPIFHPKLINNPFSKSIFEYLCNQYPQLRQMLDITYRMNDEITDVVTTKYYDTSLHSEVHAIKSDPLVASRRSSISSCQGVTDPIIQDILNQPYSIAFYNVTPKGANCKDSNPYEAALMSELARIFENNNIPVEDYAITTPYRRQTKLIRSMLTNQKTPLVNTVDALQGIGVETILISLSATDQYYLNSISPQSSTSQLQFILNPNRMNVSISRAKTKVIIVGDKEMYDELIVGKILSDGTIEAKLEIPYKDISEEWNSSINKDLFYEYFNNSANE